MRWLQALIRWPGRVIHWMLYARPIRFTRLGVLYILFSLAVGAAAVNSGNNLLYLILGFLLGMIVVSGVLSDSSLWGLEIQWHPLGDGYARQPAAVDISFRKRWMPAVTVEMEITWEGLPPIHRMLYWVWRDQAPVLRETVTPLRRGWLRASSVRCSTRFPFGLFEKSHRWVPDQKWLVFPEVRPLSQPVLDSLGNQESDRPHPHKGLGTTPFDLRDFRAGDPSRQIHWKTSARRGRLMVKEMEEEKGWMPTLVIREWPRYPPEEQERFISFIASLAFHLYRRGRGVGLYTPAKSWAPDVSTSHMKDLLGYLALVDPSHEAEEARLPQRAVPSFAIDVVNLWERTGTQ